MRFLIGLIVLCAGLYLFHNVSVYEGLQASRGQGDWAVLVEDAPFLLRFAGALLLILGGAISLRYGWSGFILTVFGVLAHIVLTAAMVAMGADISLWGDDAALTGVLALLCAGLFVFRRN